MPKKSNLKLSDANLEIMKVVWTNTEVTVNHVLEAVNEKRKIKLKRATVQIQLQRLERYGWLRHRQIGREFLYSSLRSSEAATREILDNIRNRVFDGSHTELVRFLFSESEVPDEEMTRIFAFLQTYRAE